MKYLDRADCVANYMMDQSLLATLEGLEPSTLGLVEPRLRLELRLPESYLSARLWSPALNDLDKADALSN